jgi:hypothetical protein
MKRDMKLIYEILKRIEEFKPDPEKSRDFVPMKFDEQDKDHVLYQIRLLADSGFIKVRKQTHEVIFVEDMTWNGHNLLDQLREQFEKSGRSGVH